jgi:hypothetical protein
MLVAMQNYQDFHQDFCQEGQDLQYPMDDMESVHTLLSFNPIVTRLDFRPPPPGNTGRGLLEVCSYEDQNTMLYLGHFERGKVDDANGTCFLMNTAKLRQLQQDLPTKEAWAVHTNDFKKFDCLEAVCKFTGPFHQYMSHNGNRCVLKGEATCTYKDGTECKGYFLTDKNNKFLPDPKLGVHEITYPNKDTFKGRLYPTTTMGLFQKLFGHSTVTGEEGVEVYVGTYSDPNQKSTAVYGTYMWPTADTYVGDMIDIDGRQEMHGSGTITFYDGDTFEGTFRRNNPEKGKLSRPMVFANKPAYEERIGKVDKLYRLQGKGKVNVYDHATKKNIGLLLKMTGTFRKGRIYGKNASVVFYNPLSRVLTFNGTITRHPNRIGKKGFDLESYNRAHKIGTETLQTTAGNTICRFGSDWTRLVYKGAWKESRTQANVFDFHGTMAATYPKKDLVHALTIYGTLRDHVPQGRCIHVFHHGNLEEYYVGQYQNGARHGWFDLYVHSPMSYNSSIVEMYKVLYEKGEQVGNQRRGAETITHSDLLQKLIQFENDLKKL